jgi:3-hydroxyisobutyrate dehydrogenase-like beta-hydroxyacid dehydrogenase
VIERAVFDLVLVAHQGRRVGEACEEAGVCDLDEERAAALASEHGCPPFTDLDTALADADVTLGGTAHLDVLTESEEYGLRTPGKRVVYTATGGPDSSLADIANDLDG